MGQVMQYGGPHTMIRYAHSLLLLFPFALSAQTPVARLTNPSFEGKPKDAMVPNGWFVHHKGSTPDILPGPWGVQSEAADGDTYIGLITREDGSYEDVAQRLSNSLRSGECYTFSLKVAFSNTYAGYNKPLRLKIYLGRSKGDKSQLIGETGEVGHLDWKKVELKFNATGAYQYLLIEAHPAPGSRKYYRGNILVDDCSDVVPCQRA